MTMIAENWTTAIVKQRGDDGDFMAEGKFFQKKPHRDEVDVYNKENRFFPSLHPKKALPRDLAYIFVFPFHKVLISIGNITALVLQKFPENRYPNLRKFKGFLPHTASDRVKTLGKDAAILGIPLALRYVQPTVLGLGVYDLLYSVAGVAACAYAVRDPKGMRVWIAKVEEQINIKSLNDYQVSKLDAKGVVFAVLDGSYSLSRILGIHCLGKSSDKVLNKDKFKFCKPKKA